MTMKRGRKIYCGGAFCFDYRENGYEAKVEMWIYYVSHDENAETEYVKDKMNIQIKMRSI